MHGHRRRAFGLLTRCGLVRVPLAHSRMARAAIGKLQFVRSTAVRLGVLRAFGSATCARRALARRLEEATAGADGRARKAMQETLDMLAELQRAR